MHTYELGIGEEREEGSEESQGFQDEGSKGIVRSKSTHERPLIIKASVSQTHAEQDASTVEARLNPHVVEVAERVLQVVRTDVAAA
eukprot:784274-Pleurochrysis_carterae.AAC.2